MNSGDHNYMHDMYRDNLGFPNQHDFTDDHSLHHFRAGLNEETESFYKYVNDTETPLYLGCTTFTKLSFIIELFHLECLNNISDKAFTMILQLLKNAEQMLRIERSK